MDIVLSFFSEFDKFEISVRSALIDFFYVIVKHVAG